MNFNFFFHPMHDKFVAILATHMSFPESIESLRSVEIAGFSLDFWTFNVRKFKRKQEKEIIQ
jgi:hypothetical protein